MTALVHTVDLTVELSVRKAGPDDAPALAAFAERVFRDTFGPHHRADDMDAYCGAAFAVEQQRRELSERDDYTGLAVVRGELAGYVQLHVTEPPPCVTGPAPLELKRIYVDPRWHGGGIAQALMTHAFEIAQQRGARTLYLSVWQHNHRAIAFYVKRGFRQVGTAPFQLGADQQIDPVMECAVPAAASSATTTRQRYPA